MQSYTMNDHQNKSTSQFQANEYTHYYNRKTLIRNSSQYYFFIILTQKSNNEGKLRFTQYNINIFVKIITIWRHHDYRRDLATTSFQQFRASKLKKIKN